MIELDLYAALKTLIESFVDLGYKKQYSHLSQSIFPDTNSILNPTKTEKLILDIINAAFLGYISGIDITKAPDIISTNDTVQWLSTIKELNTREDIVRYITMIIVQGMYPQ